MSNQDEIQQFPGFWIRKQPPPIMNFEGEFGFLSNFWPSLIIEGDERWITSEREKIRNAPTPGKAKRLGRKATLRDDWDGIKITVMLHTLRLKFGQNRKEREMLLATGDRLLIEGNHWGDTFWGVCDGEGENMLGILLMQVRDEINREAKS